MVPPKRVTSVISFPELIPFNTAKCRAKGPGEHTAGFFPEGIYFDGTRPRPGQLLNSGITHLVKHSLLWSQIERDVRRQ